MKQIKTKSTKKIENTMDKVVGRMTRNGSIAVTVTLPLHTLGTLAYLAQQNNADTLEYITDALNRKARRAE